MHLREGRVPTCINYKKMNTLKNRNRNPKFDDAAGEMLKYKTIFLILNLSLADGAVGNLFNYF